MKISFNLLLLSATFLFFQACSKSTAGDVAKKSSNRIPSATKAKATFAGGCFWCMEKPFEAYSGVHAVVSGYAGGVKKNPSYQEVAHGQTKYIESVQVTYDPSQISYEDLLQIFWRSMDPTDAGGQFHDRGHQYSTAIFYHNDEQKKAAEASKKALAASDRFDEEIVTDIRPFTTFYKAEDYHQDYYKTNTAHYQRYLKASGREAFIEKNWGDEKKWQVKGPKKPWTKFSKPDDTVLKEKLSAEAYHITQKDGTERPFKNAYWDHKKEGIYVDVVSGEPLFSSTDKFKSGTGWPSFTKPLVKEYVIDKTDDSLGMRRTEVRSKFADSHLGHVFSDGPEPTGLRYCINSAALRFVPKEKLKSEGYGEYLILFEKQ